jgi:MFS family permease
MRLRSVFALLCWEGAFAMAYESWVGVTFLSGLGGELGVSVGTVSLLVAVPWIGAIGQIFGLWAFERVSSIRRYTLCVATAARALWAVPLVFAGFWMWRASQYGSVFPRSSWLFLLTCVACFSALLATSSSAAWMAWVQEIVPENFRGRFFGARQRFTVVAVIFANLVGAACVAWKPEGYFLGYALMGVLALVAGAMSVYLLSRVPDAARRVRLERPKRQARPGRLRLSRPISFDGLLEPLQDASFRRVLIFGAAFNGAVQLTGPFFPYYFTKELGIPMSSIALWTVMTQIGGFASAALWGRKIDQSRDPARMIFIAGNLIALSPLIYSFRAVETIPYFAPFDYTLSGVAWTGYTLAFNTLLFRVCPLKRNAVCFSLYTACAGLAGAAGNLLGGWLAVELQPWGGFRALFLLGGITRFALVWGLSGLLRSVPVVSPGSAVSELEKEPDPAESDAPAPSAG